MRKSSGSRAKLEMLDIKKPGFPAPVKEVFEALRDEVTFLHGAWHVFQQLFKHRDTAEAVKMTPGGFSIINLAFRREIIMGISRITDRKTVMGHETLTIAQLRHVVEDNCKDLTFVDSLKAIEKEIQKACEPVRRVRNQTLAHLDLKRFLNPEANTLPGIDAKKVQACLDLLAKFMNSVLGYFTPIHIDFVPHISPAPGNIIHGLADYQRYRNVIAAHERKKALGEK